MATADFRGQQELRGQQDRLRPATTTSTSTAGMVSAGAGFGEVVCAIAVIALSIAGLVGLYPVVLAGVAMIVFGAALVLGNGGLMAYFSRLNRRPGLMQSQTFAGGMGAETLGGIAGIVLGILTLVNVAPFVLLSVSIIVFGASVILGAASRVQLAMRTMNRLDFAAEDTQMFQEAHTASIGARSLVGLAAIVLGIIAVCWLAYPATSLLLSLVGLLCLGAGSVFTGAALGTQAMSTTSNR
jgi:hypothetical protein